MLRWLHCLHASDEGQATRNLNGSTRTADAAYLRGNLEELLALSLLVGDFAGERVIVLCDCLE